MCTLTHVDFDVGGLFQEYIVRVVDVESGVVWFTRKRFRELYKLHRKVRASLEVTSSRFHRLSVRILY